MLDDLKYIHQKDAQDALGVAEKQWQQLTYNFKTEFEAKEPIQNVVLAGMGGSALAALLLASWPQLNVPHEVIRGYDLPEYASTKTLFIALSYSGNTEETLSALEAAKKHGCQIVIIASGGKLEEEATNNNYPFYKIPSGFQPRMAVFYNFAALVQLLNKCKLTQNNETGLVAAAEWLKDSTSGWLADVPTKENEAKQIAQELMGKSPAIYAGPLLSPAAYKWKINFNENAKNVAWFGVYPEFSHNEFMGWSSHPVDKPYGVIDLRSNLEHPRIQKRFEVTERLLSGKRPSPIVVDARGDNVIKQLLWTIVLGDFVSIYLGILNGVDPGTSDAVEKFKKELG